MSITDELREWTRTHTVNCSDNRIALVAIADRIDEAHKHAIAYVDDRDPEMMVENGWVRLPVDADGVPIRVGDEMEPISVKYDRFGVVTLCLDTRDGRWSLLTDLDGEWSHDELCQLRHHTPPTVEDVLQEFADRVCNSGHQWGLEAADTIAEYAAKLRLKEDA